MENRRDFFKALGAFAAGVVGAKVSTYIPKKEEPKEEMLVSSAITLVHEGKEYYPLVVKKTEFDGVMQAPTFSNSSFEVSSVGTIQIPKPKIRKANT